MHRPATVTANPYVITPSCHCHRVYLNPLSMYTYSCHCHRVVWFALCITELPLSPCSSSTRPLPMSPSSHCHRVALIALYNPLNSHCHRVICNFIQRQYCHRKSLVVSVINIELPLSPRSSHCYHTPSFHCHRV